MDDPLPGVVRRISPPDTSPSPLRQRADSQHRFPLTRITMPTTTSSPTSRTNPLQQAVHAPPIPPSRATSDDPAIMLEILRQRRRPRSGGGTQERLRRLVASSESESMREFLKEWAKEGGSSIEKTAKEDVPLAQVQRRKRGSVAPLPDEALTASLTTPPAVLLRETMEVQNPEFMLTLQEKNKPLPPPPESARTKSHIIVVRPSRWLGFIKQISDKDLLKGPENNHEKQHPHKHNEKPAHELFDMDDEVIVYDIEDDEESESDVDTEVVRVLHKDGGIFEAKKIQGDKFTDNEDDEKKESWVWTAFFVPVLKTLVYIVRPCGARYN